jgi:hypothetical protein
LTVAGVVSVGTPCGFQLSGSLELGDDPPVQVVVWAGKERENAGGTLNRINGEVIRIYQPPVHKLESENFKILNRVKYNIT